MNVFCTKKVQCKYCSVYTVLALPPSGQPVLTGGVLAPDTAGGIDDNQQPFVVISEIGNLQ